MTCYVDTHFFSGFAFTDMEKSVSIARQIACQSIKINKPLYLNNLYICCDTLFCCDTLLDGSVIFFSTEKTNKKA